MGILGSTCDVSTGLRFFKICHGEELNKIIEATMPVNPYDDRRISLQWLKKRVIGHGTVKVNSSEGKCNRGINALYVCVLKS